MNQEEQLQEYNYKIYQHKRNVIILTPLLIFYGVLLTAIYNSEYIARVINSATFILIASFCIAIWIVTSICLIIRHKTKIKKICQDNQQELEDSQL